MDVRENLKLLDDLYTQGKLKQSEEYLSLWLEAALNSHNYAAALTFYNETEGLYRTTGRAVQAAEISDKALQLIETMGLNGTIHHATTLLNGATANRWANNLEKALDMYQQAADIYNKQTQKNSYLMASLYNNISHIYQQQNNHRKALKALEAALAIVMETTDNAAEIATTKVTMALSYMALNDMHAAKMCLDDASQYYNSTEGQNDGHRGSFLSALGEYFWHSKEYDNAISAYEKGTRRPAGEKALEVYEALADHFNVDLAYLIGQQDHIVRLHGEGIDPDGADLIVEVTPEELALIKQYRLMDQYAKKLIRMAAHMEDE